MSLNPGVYRGRASRLRREVAIKIEGLANAAGPPIHVIINWQRLAGRRNP
jgi:hypothetical protein